MSTDPTYQYTIEDIRRYLSGSMSPAEMHEMEKAALTDPFLADALDGYRNATPSVTDAHLNEIRSLVAGQGKQKASAPPVVILHKPRAKWWRGLAAAAVIGIMAAGAWLFMKPEPAPAPLAKNTAAAAPPATAEQATGTGAGAADTAINTPLSNKVAIAEKKAAPQSSAKKTVPRVNVPESPADDAKAIAADAAPNVATAPVVSALRGSLPPANAEAANRSAANPMLRIRGINSARTTPFGNLDTKNQWGGPIGATAKTPPATGNLNFIMAKNEEQSYYLGRVTDTAGVPIAGVTITTSRNYSTLSNADGSFRLPAQDSAGNLAFMAPGYGLRTQQLLAGKTAGVQLTASDAGLNEVVVVGYGTQRKKAITGSISSYKVDTLPYKESPYPQGGWDSFYNKLATEMGVNSSNASKDLHLRFTVENGEPEKFTVVKTPDEATAQKAISIIKKGPKWKSSKRKKKVDLKIKVD
ncbi:carboxypeptidase regulatory-like domain-containing protein [Niabella drilacis]|uniref:Carboxypeptidase regulatory-like domain-containing protein n=1 Tax=Niabella drilacis (strain DSM 25811 / CCM 8410 / CCUG 62505 / LMG 26954 / E90) TaxID=1285928 RepID=A0A1G6ZH95_NIADE|nr:carboxypeptidase regulatory-like domain-containing protein [Niabella drilacis]SDE01960.1 Carboxypeptidase regulatory-like domain-containing protein [Niabella drilacis]